MLLQMCLHIVGMTICFYLAKVYYCFGIGSGQFIVLQTLGERASMEILQKYECCFFCKIIL